MKNELKDIVIEVVTKTVPAGAVAWWSQVSLTALLTGVLVLLQIAYLLRKWWREETEWGLRLKRWAQRHGMTQPGDIQ